MALLTQIAFTRDEHRYELDIDLDDEAIIRDQLACVLTARVIDPEGEEHEVEVRLEIDFAANVARVTLPDGTEHEIDLGGIHIYISDEEERVPGLDPDSPSGPDELYERVSEALGPALLEIIDEIPLGDPLLCLVKAGVSSTIGQAMVCREIAGGGVRAIFGCLREHVAGILIRTLWRTAKCMAFL